MGLFVSKLWTSVFGKDPVRILMVGLDAAGKTCILYRLKLGDIVETIPTIGFNVETVTYRNIEFTVWDIGGRDTIRPLYRHYYEDTEAFIFVLDSSDSERLFKSREELHHMLSEEQLRDVPVLIFANKQDLPNAMSMDDITEQLELDSFEDRKWFVQPSNAVDGSGLFNGLDWLSENVSR